MWGDCPRPAARSAAREYTNTLLNGFLESAANGSFGVGHRRGEGVKVWIRCTPVIAAPPGEGRFTIPSADLHPSSMSALCSRPPGHASGTSGSSRARSASLSQTCGGAIFSGGRQQGSVPTFAVSASRRPHDRPRAVFGRTRRVRSDRESLHDAGQLADRAVHYRPFRLIRAFKLTSGTTHLRFDALQYGVMSMCG